MTGGPELRPAAAEGAAPGRAPGGKRGPAGEGASAPFDALLSRMVSRGGSAATADARPAGRLVDTRAAEAARLAALSLDRAEAGPEVAALHAAPEAQALAQALAQGVAERIAATLAEGQAESAPAAAGVESAGAAGRRGAALAANIVMAASLARRPAEEPGALTERPARLTYAVTHRETVFAAATLSGARAQAAGHSTPSGADVPSAGHGEAAFAAFGGGSKAGRAAADGGHAGTEPGADRAGRAEQLMLGDRAVAGRTAPSPAKAPDIVASALVRAAAEEAKPLATPASGDAAPAPYEGTALGLPGGADQRAQGAAAPAAVQAAQPAAAPSTVPVAPGAVKVLQIQLQPADLGVLEVRMRVTDGRLEVHIEAGRPETVALLKSDRDTLEGLLRGAGHAVDAVTVRLADKSGDASGQPSQEGGQGPASGARSDAQAGSAREQGGRFDDRSPSRPGGAANEKVHDDQDQSVVAGRPRGGLYL